MRRADRLFELIQLLRGASRPITAEALAERLEVSVRTVYRDIAALQARRTPIDGEAGIGYVMRAGYDLPPLNFDADEAEAIVVGLSLLARTGDVGLQRAASRVFEKIDSARARRADFRVSDWGVSEERAADLSVLRAAIRDEHKLRLAYVNAEGDESERTVRPIAVIYYVSASVLVAWCELREGFRHFRPDRMRECEVLDARFAGEGAALRRQWESVQTAQPSPD